MNWKAIAFGGAVVGGLVYIVSKFANAIQYNFVKIKWLGRDGLKLQFAVVYELYNTNDIPCTVSNLSGKIMYGDYRLNDFVNATPITVAPGARENLEVKFTVSPGMLLGEILRFIDEKSGLKKFKMVGWMSGKVGQVPFKIPINEKLELAD